MVEIAEIFYQQINKIIERVNFIDELVSLPGKSYKLLDNYFTKDKSLNHMLNKHLYCYTAIIAGNTFLL